KRRYDRNNKAATVAALFFLASAPILARPRRRGNRITAFFPQCRMSAFGTKRTFRDRVPMSAFGSKGDMGQPYLPQGGAWSRSGLAMGRPQRHYNASGKTDLAWTTAHGTPRRTCYT